MKANELMIGNWVEFNGSSYQIEEISKKGWVHITVNGVRVPMTTDYLLEVLEGVPLTAEILEKNGFVVTKERHIIEDLGVAIIYGKYERLDEDKMLCHGDSLWPIKYVHQLQNALCLCGINKEIVL